VVVDLALGGSAVKRRFRKFEVFDVLLPLIIVGCIVAPLGYGLNERFMWYDYRRDATLEEMRRHARDWSEFEAARMMLDRLSKEFGCASSLCWDAIVDTFVARMDGLPMSSGVDALASGFEAGVLLGPYGQSCEEYAVTALIHREAKESVRRESEAARRAAAEQAAAMRARDEMDSRRRDREREQREAEFRQRQREQFGADLNRTLQYSDAVTERLLGPLVRQPAAEPEPPPFAGGNELGDSAYWRRRLERGY
jgi:hypothetical protein